MALFQKKNSTNPLAALETELTSTKRKRDDLVTRRDKLAHALAEAEEQRKAALLIDDNDESDAALAKAASSVESYRSSLQGVDLVLGEHDARIADLELQIATGLDRQRREARAQALEAKSKNASAALDAYLTASDTLADALEGTGVFEADEIVIWARRLASDFRAGRAQAFRSIDNKIQSLRAPPPKPAVQPEPPALGQWSDHKRKFSQLVGDGSAVGDRAPDHRYYYGGLGEPER